MYCNLTHRFINAFPKNTPNDEVIELVNKRLKLVKNDKENEFFAYYFDRYEYFPTPKRVNTILKERPDLKIEIDYFHSDIQKTHEWNGIKLFSSKYENGQECIICGSPIKNNNCMVVEKGQDGYDKVQLCACCGGDPGLSLIDEWKAFCTREGYVSYQIYYFYKLNKESMKRELRGNEALKLKEMEG